MANRIHFKYWKSILIARFFEQFLRNDSTRALQWPQKNFKLLIYEHIIYSFEARDLEISNMQLLLRNV